MSSDIASIWSLATILGPIMFLAVLAWIVIRNRNHARDKRDMPKRPTQDLYLRFGRENKSNDAGK